MANKEKIVCFSCKKPIHGPRTVINGQWHCAQCTYRIDVPGTEIAVSPPRRTSSSPPGDQTLFETDSYIRRRNG
jgi:ribosomal protein L37AE/L43A